MKNGIDFSYSDYNVQKIKTETGFDWQTETKLDYKVFGLKDDGENAPIEIEFNKKEDYGDRINRLARFFDKNGIGVNFKNSGGNTINIGLRKDLRRQLKLSAAIVSTIVYTMEGKIKLNNSKVLGIPKFNGEKI
jgi:hypothetical protein